jgi:uncharacterized protein YkwD
MRAINSSTAGRFLPIETAMTPIPTHLHTSHRRTRAVATLILAAALGLACTAVSTSAASAKRRAPRPAPVAAPTDPEVASFVREVNAYRVSIGLEPLIWDRGVAAVARAHSRNMVAHHFFSHTDPDGLRSKDRFAAAGIRYAAMGENIAYGHETGASVLKAWLKSPGHRANIEDPTYTRHGVGKVGTYWTHDFLRPRTTITTSR